MNTRHKDLSAEARRAKADQLDAAIDRVAARMTAVREDDLMTARIVSTLPDRSPFGAWLMGAWAPRLAALALVVIGVALWDRNGIEGPELPGPATAVRPSLDPALVAFAPVVRPVVPVLPSAFARVTTSELRRDHAEDGVDFDRSLPALGAMSELSLGSLTPRELPAHDALGLAPIEISELALTIESFPQQR
jgi:hypothetical protein